MAQQKKNGRGSSGNGSPLGVKLIAILAAIGVGVAGVAFGAGFLTGAKGHSEVASQLAAERANSKQKLGSQREELEADREKAVAKVSKQCKTATSRLATEQTRVAKLEARRELGRVLLALDDRNFGIAQKHLDASVAHMEKGGDSEAVAAVLAELRKSKVTVAGNLNQQRTTIREHIDQLDRLFDSSR